MPSVPIPVPVPEVAGKRQRLCQTYIKRVLFVIEFIRFEEGVKSAQWNSSTNVKLMKKGKKMESLRSDRSMKQNVPDQKFIAMVYLDLTTSETFGNTRFYKNPTISPISVHLLEFGNSDIIFESSDLKRLGMKIITWIWETFFSHSAGTKILFDPCEGFNTSGS